MQTAEVHGMNDMVCLTCLRLLKYRIVAEVLTESTEASPSPESDWWLDLCKAVQLNLCCGRVR